MLGIRGVADRSSNNVLYQSWLLLAHVRETQWSTVIIAGAVIAGAFCTARLKPKAPAPLIGVMAAVAIALVFGLHPKEVGKLPLEMPPFAGFVWRPSDVYTVLPQACGLAFVSSVNILITSRVVEHFRGRHKHLRASDSDAELGAFGIANMISGVFGAPMSVGIPARSLASVRSGGTTRLSNLFHAAFILAFILLGAKYISRVPIPALAGVTAYIGICLLEWGAWKRLRRMGRVDALAFLSTSLAVLVTNSILAVAIGCSFYAARYLYRRYKMTSVESAVPANASGMAAGSAT
jgi:SulP family sulfate permease